jgi:hypothetical protein
VRYIHQFSSIIGLVSEWYKWGFFRFNCSSDNEYNDQSGKGRLREALGSYGGLMSLVYEGTPYKNTRLGLCLSKIISSMFMRSKSNKVNTHNKIPTKEDDIEKSSILGQLRKYNLM